MKRDLYRLQERKFDIAVIGAGIYGAAIAWDATLRGLSVALIDKGDFGGATSSNSLKIIHGGLRYLQKLDFFRMRESIRERTTLMGIAPHLVHTLPCVMPTYGHLMKSRGALRMGLLINDIISFDRNRLKDPGKRIPKGRILSREECLRRIAGVDSRRVTGGALWTDAQLYNSERVLLSFVHSAANGGAACANYVQAGAFLKEGNRVAGVKAVDVLTGDPLELRAATVVNASGGWMDTLLKEGGGTGKGLRLSTAMNLVIRREAVRECAAGVRGDFECQVPGRGTFRGRRILFLAPWRGVTLAGTYHIPYDGHPDALCVTEEEVHTFLKEINSALPDAPIRREEVSFFHKGFLPMDGIHPKTGEVCLTRHFRIHDHSREDGLEGLLSVAGVKYTTARDVAEKAVDLAIRKLGKKPRPCMTHNTPLAGGNIGHFADFMAEALKKKACGLDPAVARHLVYTYGSEYARILQILDEQSGLKENVPGSEEVLLAEVYHGIREEMAQKLTDVVLRRTDLGSLGHPGREALEACAGIMAEELLWDDARKKEEIEETEAVFKPK